MTRRPLALAVCLSFLAAAAAAQPGPMIVPVTFNPTPSPAWNPNVPVTLTVDARRSPDIGSEDIFAVARYGQQPRVPGLVFDFSVPGVHPQEDIIIQGYMCAFGGTGDCYPSDVDNPPSCSVAVKVLPGRTPSCRPVFTWSGGQGGTPVRCSATCR
jgi:hypothetical protein